MVVRYRRFGTANCPIYKGEAVKDCLDGLNVEEETDRVSRNIVTNSFRCVTSQKSEDVVYTAAEACGGRKKYYCSSVQTIL